MNTRLFITLTMLACCTGTLAAKTPVQEAKDHLENALGFLTQKDEGAGRKRKTSIPNIISVLSKAEFSLNEVKSNKGTNAALQLVATAKAELEAAKAGEGDHLQRAETAIQEALKRVLKIIQINKS